MLKIEFKFECKRTKESVTQFRRCIQATAKEILRISQAQFREQLRKVRPRQSAGDFIKKRVFTDF